MLTPTTYGILIPVYMVYLSPTHGILTPSTHGILTPLSMVYRPPTHGISTPYP